jgi:poly-gamma-glutamate synthesis protein (capsule biosynthesis protein)
MVYESESGSILMAFTGESLISRALKPYREPKFLELQSLLHSAAVRFTNAEMLFHNYENYPTFRPGGTYMRCDPRYLEDLKWFGINIVGTANNHAYDYGEGGILTNLNSLNEYGIPFAGTGEHMGDASKPVYMDTANGRVALIAATSSGPIAGRAGEQRRDIKGRPGSNYVRFEQYWQVDREAFEALKRVADSIGWTETANQRRNSGYENLPAESADEVLFLDHGMYSDDSFSRFVVAEAFEKHSRINESDLERQIRSVRDAARMADWVLFTVHNHEGGQTADEPGDHIVELAHAVIDAGAHAFIGHGPHQDRGIEIYNGRPIFYSLGNLMLQNDAVERVPHDNFERAGLSWESSAADFYDHRSGNGTRGQTVQTIRWQSAVGMGSYCGRELKELVLRPVDLGFGTSRSQQGRPVLAEGEVADEIIDRFQRFSKPFGTDIQADGQRAVIKL